MKYPVLSGYFSDRFHLLFFDHKRNHPGACHLISLFYRGISVSAGDHHLPEAVDFSQEGSVDLEQAIHIRDQLDLAFLGGCRVHISPVTDLIQNPGRLILVQHRLVLFPDIEMFLAHRKKDGDILLRYHMTLAEYSILGDAADNLRNIMTQYMADCILCSDQLHDNPPVK